MSEGKENQGGDRLAEFTEFRQRMNDRILEAAAILGISEKTARNDWRFARAWLHGRLLPEDNAV